MVFPRTIAAHEHVVADAFSGPDLKHVPTPVGILLPGPLRMPLEGLFEVERADAEQPADQAGVVEIQLGHLYQPFAQVGVKCR